MDVVLYEDQPKFGECSADDLRMVSYLFPIRTETYVRPGASSSLDVLRGVIAVTLWNTVLSLLILLKTYTTRGERSLQTVEK